MKNIEIFITTYNRSDRLESTLKQLLSEADFFRKNNVKITVYDDCSVFCHQTKNESLCKSFGVSYFKNNKNFGKRKYWKLYNRYFQYLSKREFDYAFFLQDDYTYIDSFLTKALGLYSKVEEWTDCLNLREDRVGQRFWNKSNHISKKVLVGDEYFYKVYWVDCVFLASRNLFQRLDFILQAVKTNRWFNKPKKSSGVGEQMSSRLKVDGHVIYQPSSPLLEHTGLNFSEMNKWRNI